MAFFIFGVNINDKERDLLVDITADIRKELRTIGEAYSDIVSGAKESTMNRFEKEGLAIGAHKIQIAYEGLCNHTQTINNNIDGVYDK